MDDNNALQDRLNYLEKGLQPDQVAVGLPEAEAELVFLAAALRELPKAQMAPAVAARQRQNVVRAANALNNPVRPAPTFSLNWILFPAVGMVFMVFAAALILALNLYAGQPGPRPAILANVSGIVEMSKDGKGDDWQVVSNGEKIEQGQRLRTRIDSSAVLVYFDGSTTSLLPESQAILTNSSSGWAGAVQVRINQISGETHHAVIPFKSQSSFFEVTAGNGTASVHGTDFEVDVAENGQAIFSVNEGEVNVASADGQVVLSAGEVSAVSPGQKPNAPAYQFSLQGQIGDVQDGTWVINNIPVEVDPANFDAVLYQTGDWVSVKGRVLSGGNWVVDRVNWTDEEVTHSAFTGLVEDTQSGQLKVNGQTIKIIRGPSNENLKVGDKISISFTKEADGSMQAVGVESLKEKPSTAGAKATSKAEDKTATAQDTATGVPPTKAPTDEPGPSNSATPRPGSTDTSVPAATDTAEPTDTDVPATAIPTQAPTSTSAPTETSAPAFVPSIVPSDTPVPVPTDTSVPDPVTAGSGNNNGISCIDPDHTHPQGRRLAERYSVPYEEIMGWFCQGYGFGEIDLAYELSATSGKPVVEIFAMRASGSGWGEIKKSLDNSDNSSATLISGGKAKQDETKIIKAEKPIKPVKTKDPKKDKPGKPNN